VDSDQFEPARAALEALVALRSEQHRCSISWGVVDGRELVLSGAVGHDSDPVPTPRTVFRIASMTKSFTAAAVMMLRDEGALRLDDVVGEIAPEFRAVRGPTSDSPPIRVRDLLSMAAGMTTDDAWADRHLDITDDELDALLGSGATFSWAPQSHGEYSNLGFAMLGRVIMLASGVRAQDFITTRLLRPLGMTRTSWVAPNDDDWARPHEVIDGRRHADIEPLADGAIAPMGGLWSCLADLAIWVAWLADAFPPRDAAEEGPLCRASRREMQQVQRSWPTVRSHAAGQGHDSVPERIDGGGYGYGLFVVHDDRFRHFVQHSGGLPGYGSNMRWLPDRRLGIIALANSTYAPMSAMARRMMEILDDSGLVPTVTVEPSAALAERAARLAAVLSMWSDAEAAALFADNVALDEPMDRRAEKARAAAAAHGALTVDRYELVTPSRGSLVMRHDDGTVVNVEVELSPTSPPQIQFYEVGSA
jgi:CubicO group peptidase (beta-lactamase class C family)